MSYFDLLPKELITSVINHKLDSASAYTLFKAYNTSEDSWTSERTKHTEYKSIEDSWTTEYTERKGAIIKLGSLSITCDDMCKYGDTFLKYFKDKGMILSEDIFRGAIVNNNVKMLEDVKCRPFEFRITLIYLLFKHNTFETFDWVLDRYSLSLSLENVIAMAIRGQIKQFDYVYNHKLWDWEAHSTAAVITTVVCANHLDVLKWLNDKGILQLHINIKNSLFKYARDFNNVNIVLWLTSTFGDDT